MKMLDFLQKKEKKQPKRTKKQWFVTVQYCIGNKLYEVKSKNFKNKKERNLHYIDITDEVMNNKENIFILGTDCFTIIKNYDAIQVKKMEVMK